MSAEAPRVLMAGEGALTVEFGETIDPALNARVGALDAALAAADLAGVVEAVPTYRSLTVHYDPGVVSFAGLSRRLLALAAHPGEAPAARRWRVPACYDPPFDEDTAEVAQALGLTRGQVAALHAGARYRVYMYGFAPGYLFLGGLPAALDISRRPTPRPPVPPGALLIAGGQALIASVSMPTGWRMIGRTPSVLFDPAREPMAQARIGDEIVFEPVDAARFADLSARRAGLSPAGG
ncbi:allophanate hydrolase subunit 1 [Methylocella sp.]|uniref:5-oxoprolinase subunit B family protein n=1 Tax=Methylocella sp. TaxID=1978226 RepID=UPI0035B10B4E